MSFKKKNKKKMAALYDQYMIQQLAEQAGKEALRTLQFTNASIHSTAVQMEMMIDGVVVNKSFDRLEASQSWRRIMTKPYQLKITIGQLVLDLDITEAQFLYRLEITGDGGFFIGRLRYDGQEDTTYAAWKKPVAYSKDAQGNLTLLATSDSHGPSAETVHEEMKPEEITLESQPAQESATL